MEPWVAVIGTLLGVVIGTSGGYLVQRAMHRQQAEERDSLVRRETYTEFVTHAHGVFESIKLMHNRLRSGALTSAEASANLKEYVATESQATLEGLRMVGTNEVATAAARLWEHLRLQAPARGIDLERSSYELWRDQYWLLRRKVIDAARADVGLDPLDWGAVGIRPKSRLAAEADDSATREGL
jgi:hypothetical protein